MSGIKGTIHASLGALGLALAFAGCKQLANENAPVVLRATSYEPFALTLSWSPNHEKGVNSAGGGYRVYYSINTPFDSVDDAQHVLTVPYVSGALAPSQLTLANQRHRDPNTYYFKVVAFTATDTTGSAPSNAYILKVPR